MRYVNIENKPIYYLTDDEVIDYILPSPDQFGEVPPGRFVCYLGAGASVEAGVPAAQAICDDIRQRKTKRLKGPDALAEWEQRVHWVDAGLRYASCMKDLGNDAMRVQYFRELLRGRQPSFSHHAIACLMRKSLLKRTCLTTNFDKLLENAFTQQGGLECQSIRNDGEVKYWQNEPDRCYVIKLHGDYDTYNILNTEDETLKINEALQNKAQGILQSSGLLVLGSAGNEQSIRTLFNDLSARVGGENSLLSYGLLWGVFVGASKPKDLTSEQLEALMKKQIQQQVNREIVAMMERTRLKNSNFYFFPVWGAGNFLFSLINAAKDLPGGKELFAESALYLDHDMRLRHVFQSKGLSEKTISDHIWKLREQRKKIKPDASRPNHKVAYLAQGNEIPIEVRVVYGDITSRGQMGQEEFSSVRRAVVSPEDTCISAGGGVALQLLTKAGTYTILNELSKFSVINQGAVAVTSGGRLPVHHIFHAAAIELEDIDGTVKYNISQQMVCKTMTTVLEKAASLEVQALWVPLLGAGVAAQGSEKFGAIPSLEGILDAIAAWDGGVGKMSIIIVVYDEFDPDPRTIGECLQKKLAPTYSIRASYHNGEGGHPSE